MGPSGLRTESIADLDYRQCPWGGRLIYEMRQVRARDDRYQPLGGFAANGEPERVSDAIIRRARDWRADTGTRISPDGTMGRTPAEILFVPPSYPTAARRPVDGTRGGGFICAGRRGENC